MATSLDHGLYKRLEKDKNSKITINDSGESMQNTDSDLSEVWQNQTASRSKTSPTHSGVGVTQKNIEKTHGMLEKGENPAKAILIRARTKGRAFTGSRKSAAPGSPRVEENQTFESGYNTELLSNSHTIGENTNGEDNVPQSDYRRKNSKGKLTPRIEKNTHT
jgi:hypothetical protein